MLKINLEDEKGKRDPFTNPSPIKTKSSFKNRNLNYKGQ